MITLDETLNYLKLERDDIPEAEILAIEVLIAAAGAYLINATGVVHDKDNALAKLFCFMVVTDWYEERGTVGSIKDGARAILLQLRTCDPNGGTK